MNPELLASMNGLPLAEVETRLKALGGIVKVVTRNGHLAAMPDINWFGPVLYVDIIDGLVQNAREDL